MSETAKETLPITPAPIIEETPVKVKLRHAEVQPSTTRAGDSVKIIMNYIVRGDDSEKSIEVGESWTLMKDGQTLAELRPQKQLRTPGGWAADATMPIPTNAEPGTYVLINKVSAATSEDSLTSSFTLE